MEPLPHYVMTSPPSTPDPEGEWRLKTITVPCEWAERYRPGGFHPVDLGDKFKNDTYTVIRKLGYGAFSTVWLAVDSRNKRYVALKIMTATSSTPDTEFEMIQFLSQKVTCADPRSEHILALLDTFVHEGPNGMHRCLVFEVMGPSATLMIEDLQENQPMYYGKMRPRYPKWMAKTMLVHMLRGLAFLHENDIVHGDVQPGNILFSITDISNVEEKELRQDETLPRSTTPVHRRDDKIDKWAPKNIYLEQSLYKYVPQSSALKVKLSDLGCAFRPSDPPNKPGMPAALRAPELILGKPLGTAIDIWAFGCLMFEFLAARALFAVMTFGWDEQQQNDADDFQFIQFYKVIGQLPDSIINAWPRANKYFDPASGKRINPRPQEADDYHSDDISYERFGNNYAPLEVRFARDKHDDIDDEETTVICSIIRQTLSYSPEDRPSATDLLKHPWFTLE